MAGSNFKKILKFTSLAVLERVGSKLSDFFDFLLTKNGKYLKKKLKWLKSKIKQKMILLDIDCLTTKAQSYKRFYTLGCVR